MVRKTKKIIAYILILVCMTGVINAGHISLVRASSVSTQTDADKDDKKTTEATTEADKKTTEATTEDKKTTTEIGSEEIKETLDSVGLLDNSNSNAVISDAVSEESSSSEEAVSEEKNTESGSSGNQTSTNNTTTEEDEEPTLEQIRAGYTIVENHGIEQVQVNKPLVRFYFYYNLSAPIIDTDNINATLAGVTLTNNSVSKWGERSDLHINYYMLLDVSGSITTGNFNAAKEEIKNFAKNHMNDNDTITVYTVGDSVECIVKNEKRDNLDEIEDAIDGIVGDDNTTNLDEAISQVANSIISKNANFTDSLPDGRDIIIAFTDGANCSTEGSTRNKAAETLNNSGATLYGFLQNSVASADAQMSFNEIANDSGGSTEYFTEDNLSEELNSLVEKLKDVYVLECKDINNVKDDERKKVALKLYYDSEEIIYDLGAREVLVDKAIDDVDPPEIESVTVLSGDDANKIQVKFDESVLGADDSNHFILTKINEDGEEPISIVAIKYDELNYLTTLTLPDTVYGGEYMLEVTGVTDNTQRKNKLANSPYEFTSNGPEYVEEEVKEKKSFIDKFWWLIVIIIVVIFAAILIVVFHIIKKRKGLIVVDGKATFASNVDVKKHVVLEEEKGRDISLYLNSGGKIIKKVDTKINGSIIIGRSDLCDIFIDDATMSRQHFAIEYTDGDFYVQDLDTTNGTMLNGVKLNHKRRLEKDDRITAGSLDIIVRW